MKTVNTSVKVLTALAAVAGVVFVIAEYGDKIVAWAKELLAKCPCCNKCNIIEFTPAEAEEEPAAAAADVAANEVAPEAAEEPAEEPVEEPAEDADEEPAEVPEGEPVAEEEDFEA